MYHCDLHTHSIFSDGTDTPADILRMADKLHLTAVALCDHNTVDGLPSFLQAAADFDIEAVCGAEFSVDYDGTELHLLGLMIDPMHFDAVSHLMVDVSQRKEQSNRELIQALSEAGYCLDYDQVCLRSPNKKINRAHIAAALTEQGYTTSISDAFDRLLSKQAGLYREPKRLTVWEMLDFLSDVHAVPVLAHPLLNLSEQQLIEFLPYAKQRGLVGIEIAYPLYTTEMQLIAERLAHDFELLPSGGSDYHGSNKPDIRLGIGTGSLAVPEAWLQELKKARR